MRFKLGVRVNPGGRPSIRLSQLARCGSAPAACPVRVSVPYNWPGLQGPGRRRIARRSIRLSPQRATSDASRAAGPSHRDLRGGLVPG